MSDQDKSRWKRLLRMGHHSSKNKENKATPLPEYSPPIMSIKPQEVRSFVKNMNQNKKEWDAMAIIDVRDADRTGGHIKGSVHRPFKTLKYEPGALKQLVIDLEEKTLVIFHCMASVDRAREIYLKYVRCRHTMVMNGELVPVPSKPSVTLRAYKEHVKVEEKFHVAQAKADAAEKKRREEQAKAEEKARKAEQAKTEEEAKNTKDEEKENKSKEEEKEEKPEDQEGEKQKDHKEEKLQDKEEEKNSKAEAKEDTTSPDTAADARTEYAAATQAGPSAAAGPSTVAEPSTASQTESGPDTTPRPRSWEDVTDKNHLTFKYYYTNPIPRDDKDKEEYAPAIYDEDGVGVGAQDVRVMIGGFSRWAQLYGKEDVTEEFEERRYSLTPTPLSKDPPEELYKPYSFPQTFN